MIGFSKLYCDESFAHDPLRYGQKVDASEVQNAHRAVKSAKDRRPVTVWNITRTCNLHCVHCYSDSEEKKYEGELTHEQALAVIDDLADFGVPALLFSGGEPLLREDFFELARAAHEKGLRTVISTNATLITDEVARKLKQVGVVYVGASLDGIGEVNDRFRGKQGAYARAVKGIRNSKNNGLAISLRLTLTQHNAEEIDGIFDFVEAEEIDRVCFYHLAYAGRGRKISEEDLSPQQTRKVIDRILERTRQCHEKGMKKDILTVDQHADGVYLYLKLLKENPARAEKVRELLEWNGGGRYSSGVGIGAIDFYGEVHADQFWQNYSFGNVKERKFSEIWMDTSDPLMAGLKDRLPLLKGRCGACKFQTMCGGSLRVRAAYAHDDPWAEDPACYLTDQEIGIS